MFRSLCCALVAVLLAGPAAAAPLDAQPAARPSGANFLRDAMYEGLKEDGVSPQFAAQLAANPDFVSGCQICDATLSALKKYGQLTEVPVAQAGRGLPESLAKRLRSADADVRRPALRELIQRYIDRGYERANLPANQKAALEAEVKAMVYQPKNPDAGLPGGLKFCPSCDGACRLKSASAP